MVQEHKKILLIDPPVNQPAGLNTGLGWVAANMAVCNESVKVLGLANTLCSLSEGIQILRKKVNQLQPDIVGFNVHCTTYNTVLQMIEDLRGYFDGQVIIGGPHTVYENEKILADSPGTDLVVLGEAEEIMAEICRWPIGKYHDLEGVIFREGRRVVINPIKTIKKDFGDFLHPDYRQFGVKKIHYPYPIATSRGCPFRCSFCNPFMGKKTWRPRPLENVFEELRFAMEHFAIKSFKLVEPVFNLRTQRVIDFCEELIRRKINLPWFSASGLRADGITRETVRAMKKAGCTHIKIGVESLVPDVFAQINKGESLEVIKEAIAIIKEEDMPLWGSFIIGLPYDTYEKAHQNFKIAHELGFDFTEWSLLFPYPGTMAHKWMLEHGNIYHNIDNAHQMAVDAGGAEEIKVACDTKEFPKEERLQAFYEINWRSGNYLFSMKDPDWKKAISILKGILHYDPLCLPWHAAHLVKLLKRRAERSGKEGTMVDFAEDTF